MFHYEFPQTLHRVSFLANSRDLVTRAVRTPRVTHAVPVVPVRVHFQHDRPFTRDTVRLRERHRFLHRERVHAVHLQPRDVIPAFEVLRRLRALVHRRAHAVVVVFAHVNQGQIPKRRDVQGFEKLPLVRRAVAVHRHGDVWLFFVLHGERQAGANRGLRAHDSVSPEEVRVPFVHVHGTSHAFRRTVHASHELRHDFQGGAPAPQVRAVIAVRRHDRVLLRKRRFHPNTNRFLAVVQVTETANELAFVQHIAGYFQPAHQVRLREHRDDFRSARLHELVRGVDAVCLEGDGDGNGHRIGRGLDGFVGERALLHSDGEAGGFVRRQRTPSGAEKRARGHHCCHP
mmetsp:Transcript_7899/g.29593  ORF Transcript_7899/g.29593 Transcript_7899/m.29593 type:complete len:344 (+) Transcript_7899:726-1757(+)